MKYFLCFMTFLIFSTGVFSAELNDVQILSSGLSETGIELKVRQKDAHKDSYFYVDITRNDLSSFKKLSLAMKKLEKGEDFILNMRIKSFSASPPGSYYRSKDVVFSTTKK